MGYTLKIGEAIMVGKKYYRLAEQLESRLGVTVTSYDAWVLARAERTLQRWAEREYGDGSDYRIERDEETGIPYSVHRTGTKVRAPDLERGALKRIAAVCSALGIHYYHRQNPRRCMLYLAKEPMTGSNYSSVGIACYVDY